MAAADDQDVGLEVERVDADGVAVVALTGELDIGTADAFVGHLDEMTAQEAPRVCVDLCALRFMDSTGLQAIIRARNAALGARGKFAIACASGPPRRVLELTGMADVIAIAETRDEAVALLAQG